METQNNPYDNIMWLLLLIGVSIVVASVSVAITTEYWQRRCIDSGVGRWTVTESGHREFELRKDYR